MIIKSNFLALPKYAALPLFVLTFAATTRAQVTEPAPSAPTGSGAVAPAPPVATSTDPPNTAVVSEATGTDTAPGEVRVELVTTNGLVPTGELKSADGAVSKLDSSGVTVLQLPAGERSLSVSWQPGAAAAGAPRVIELGTVTVSPGARTTLVVSLDEGGEVLGITTTLPATPKSEAPAQPLTPGDPAAPTTPAPAAAESGKGEVVGSSKKLVKVTGQVYDRESQAPIVGASVFVFGADVETRSDAEGRFTLEIAPGSVSLAVVHPDYPTEAVIDLKFGAAGVSDLRVPLTHAADVDDVVIVGKPIEGGVANILLKRRESAAVTDALGSNEIARSTDSSASAATRRIVGATIVGGGFLFVRGLGGRYTNTRLNGVPLPSTDPDLPGFQLDLFPTALLSNLTISKTFTPDIPGDFAGGSLNIETKSYPEKFQLKLSVGISYDTQSTGRTMPDYAGGGRDFLGYDDGTRALPDAVPGLPIRTGRLGTGFSGEEISEIGASLNNNWALNTAKALPNMSFGVSVGDVFKVGGGKLGYLAALAYRVKNELVHETIRSARLEQGEVAVRQGLTREVGKMDALVGALGTVTYEPTKDDKFTLVSMLTQNGSDQTTLATGYSESEGAPIRQAVYRWIDRQLLFNQLLGSHKSILNTFDIDWQLNTSRVQRTQPDGRQWLYALEPDGENYAFADAQGSGEHLYTTLTQQDLGGGLDFKLPFSDLGYGKTGYMGQLSERRFNARRFGVSIPRGNTRETFLLPPEELFAPESSGETWQLVDVTNAQQDAHVAEQNLHAVYVQGEVAPLKWAKVNGGVRFESFEQSVQSVTPFSESDSEPPDAERRVNKDFLPAAGLVFTVRDDMFIRLAYGGTVARPQSRELSSFQSNDFVRRRTVLGNPDLKRTLIQNFDLRWEMFPSATEVFAISAFYKMFKDPIETVILNSGDTVGFQNIDSAKNYGLELEARARLDALNDMLEAWSLLSNLAIIRSRVDLTEEEQRIATSAQRPLEGQSPYVFNVGLGFEPANTGFSTFLYYNVFGRRLQEVGTGGIPDVYEEPFHSLDWTAYYEINKHFTANLSAQNLLLQPSRYTQGPIEFLNSKRGMTLGAGAGWTY